MQARSNQSDMILTSVERVDKFDSSAVAVDCPEAEFRVIDASLHQVLRRTRASEPLRLVQQTRGQKGFEAWHAIARRYGQRNMSDKNSAYAALISNMSEKDRAKHVEHFDDILRTFINDPNKLENRFGTIGDEEEMLAVKKLMPESLLNYRFGGTTMSYSELLVAPENIILHKVVTLPTVRGRRANTSPPMVNGKAAKDDGESAREEEDQRIVNLALQAGLQRDWQRKMEFRKGSDLERKRIPWWQR